METHLARLSTEQLIRRVQQNLDRSSHLQIEKAARLCRGLRFIARRVNPRIDIALARICRKQLFFSFLALLFAFPAWGTTYYVDNCVHIGSDSYDGREQTHTTGSSGPWRSIERVNAERFSPGDSILFQRSCSWFEELVPPSSGSAGAAITFAAYGRGARPVLSGSPAITDWTLFSGSIYEAKVSWSTYTSVVFEDGAYLLPKKSTSAMVAGSFHKTGTTLYVWTRDGSSPSEHAINAAEYPTSENDGLVSVRAHDYITVDNLDIERSNWYGFYFRGTPVPGLGASNLTVQNSTFRQTYQNAISSNELGTHANSDHIYVLDNTFSYCGIARASGFSREEGVAVNFLGVQTGSISGNSVDHEYGEGLVTNGGASDISITKNLVTNDLSAGIYVSAGYGLGGDTSNVSVQYNYVATSSVSYLIATESSRGENINGVNFSYNISAGGSSCTYALRFQGSGGRGVFENVLVYNNTLAGCTDAVAVHSPSGPGNGFANNILNARQFYAWVQSDSSTSNYSISYENVYTPYSSVIDWNGEHYALSTFTAAFPRLFTASIEADPQFNDSASGDFSLQPGSPGISSGQPIWDPAMTSAVSPGSSWPSSVGTITQNPSGWDLGAFAAPR